MVPNHHDRSGALERIASGVEGLDIVLGGGFFAGGVYILQGAPGAGKTILANQVCFNLVRTGKRVVYVTLLAETHARMMQNLSSMEFFDPELLREQVSFLSGFRVLEEEGLKGLVSLLRRELRAANASLLVIDGLVAAGESAATEREFKKFIHDLQIHSELANCTTFLLTSGAPRGIRPEHTMVDGIIELTDDVLGGPAERALIVSKFRGGSYLRGRHTFEITSRGLAIYPRLESWLARPSGPDELERVRVPSGVAGLDKMMGGGIPSASTTLLLGPSGAGKTTLGLHFLSRCTEDEPGLLLGTYETPQRLMAKADALRLPFRKLVEAGHVEILWWPPTEGLVDDLARQLILQLRERKAKRLFIDGLPALKIMLHNEERMSRFFAALTNELRVLGVTTLFTYETQQMIGSEVESPLTGLSTIAENILLMRFVEVDAELVRMIGVVKVRDSDIDPHLRQFSISHEGIHIEGITSKRRAKRAVVKGIGTPRSTRGRRPGRAR